MTAETHLQGVEISAAQFFEIWHHYDSDGDAFTHPPSQGRRGAEGGQARGSPGPGGERPRTAARPKAAPGPAPRPAARSRQGLGSVGGWGGAAGPGGSGRAGAEPAGAGERREFGGSGDGHRNSFCCRQWVHGREGATKLHPGAAAGAEEGRLGRLTFRPAFLSSPGIGRVFWSQLQCPGSFGSLLPSGGSMPLPRQAKGSSSVRSQQVANEVDRLLRKGEAGSTAPESGSRSRLVGPRADTFWQRVKRKVEE